MGKSRILIFRCLVALGAVAWLGAADVSAQVNDGKVPPAVAQTKTPVTMLTDFYVGGAHAPYFAGVGRGIFLDAGLDVKIQAGKSSLDAAGQVAAGAAQFGVLDPTASLLAIDKGADLLFVETYIQKNQAGLCYLKSKTTLSSVDDVAALRVGATPGDAVFIALKAMLHEKRLNVVTIDPTSYTPALIAGRIDILLCSAATFPAREVVVKQQGQEMGVLYLADNGLKSLGLVVVVNKTFAKEQPDTVKRFVQAFARSVVWSIAHPQEAANYVVKAQPDLKPDMVLASFKALVPFLSVPGREWFKMDPEAVQATVDLANSAYGIHAAKESFDNQFANGLSADLRQGRP